MTKTKPGVRTAAPFAQRELRSAPLSLTNDGQLSLFFVGVGAAFSKRRYQTNLLIVKGDDHLLVDCGTRTPQAFHELGLPIAGVRNYFVTHSHADHVGGLEEVMLVNRYGTRNRPHIWITEAFQTPLWDMSLRGGNAFNEESEGRNLSFTDYWQVHRPEWKPGFPRETYEFQVGSIRLQAFRTMHVPGSAAGWSQSFWSTGLVIDGRVLYTGDTRFDPALLDEAGERHDIEAVFHDCQFTPPGGVHASLDELRTLPADLKRKMVLMHYGDDWEAHRDRVEEGGFWGLAPQWAYLDFPERTPGRA